MEPTRAATAALALCVVLAGCSVQVGFGGETTDRGVVATDAGNATPAPDGMSAGDLPAGPRLSARVVDVVDGDTLDVRLANGSSDTVRLLGIDSPEVRAENDPAEYEGVPETAAGRDCLRAAGERASAAVRDLSGERVTLALDPEADTRGGYGRLLAYVVHDGSVVNYRLVREGHARLFDAPFARLAAFAAAERTARRTNRGLWRCRDPG